jgi:hypothetical protein
MGNASVVKRTQLPQSQTALRAAQYVRMSTDYQRYSIENQAAVIAASARLHHLAIVRTYRDEGESGLKLKNRAGLIRLRAYSAAQSVEPIRHPVGIKALALCQVRLRTDLRSHPRPCQATCTMVLPKFLPCSMPMKASGARSRPTVMSSRVLIFPSESQRAISPMACGIRAA